MNSLFNFISTTVAFLFGVGVIYLVLDVTIGKLKLIHSKFEWNGLQIKDFVFLIVAALFILVNFSFYKPY
jgi:hypothetical protein